MRVCVRRRKLLPFPVGNFRESSARAGLRPRDLVVDVDGKAVRISRDFREAMSKADTAKGVRLQVMREGSRRFVFLKSSR